MDSEGKEILNSKAKEIYALSIPGLVSRERYMVTTKDIGRPTSLLTQGITLPVMVQKERRMDTFELLDELTMS